MTPIRSEYLSHAIPYGSAIVLRNNFDYEDVYQKVMNSSDYDQETKNTLTNAIKDAYDIINDLVKNTNLSGISSVKFKEFIQPFAKPNGSGFVFTLNQGNYSPPQL